RRHTRSKRDWSSDVCSSDLVLRYGAVPPVSAAPTDDHTPTLVERASVGACSAMTVEWIDACIAQTTRAMDWARKSVHGLSVRMKIGRASCRGRGEIWVVGRT